MRYRPAKGPAHEPRLALSVLDEDEALWFASMSNPLLSPVLVLFVILLSSLARKCDKVLGSSKEAGRLVPLTHPIHANRSLCWLTDSYICTISSI